MAKDGGTSKKLEKHLEIEICAYLRSRGVFFWKSLQNGFYDPKLGRFRRQVSPYAIRGVADILGIFKGRPLAIEVKSAKGRISEEQVEFLKNFTKHGGIAGVCRSIDDAQKLLKPE